MPLTFKILTGTKSRCQEWDTKPWQVQVAENDSHRFEQKQNWRNNPSSRGNCPSGMPWYPQTQELLDLTPLARKPAKAYGKLSVCALVSLLNTERVSTQCEIFPMAVDRGKSQKAPVATVSVSGCREVGVTFRKELSRCSNPAI